ncbi:MAG: hypothetical protein MJD61_20600 [Proteobacteria bacterium]|nr:hypothetical protein [Pseudomonadota bacterium]
MASTYIEHFDAEARQLGFGVNMFVVGPWSDLDCVPTLSKPMGIGCPSDGAHLPYIVVSGHQSVLGPKSSHAELVSHELSHVLGATHEFSARQIKETDFFDRDWHVYQRKAGSRFQGVCARLRTRGAAWPHFWR